MFVIPKKYITFAHRKPMRAPERHNARTKRHEQFTKP